MMIIMPAKRIDDVTLEKLQEEMVKAVLSTQKPIKESELLKIILEKGIESIKEEDYLKLLIKKK